MQMTRVPMSPALRSDEKKVRVAVDTQKQTILLSL